MITNPPFRLAEDFIRWSLPIARRGVAMLTRTVFIESVGRYEQLFKPHPPTTVAQFTERVVMLRTDFTRQDQQQQKISAVIVDRSRLGKSHQIVVFSI